MFIGLGLIPSGVPTLANAINLKQSNTSVFRAAVAATQAGTANTKVAFVGDSTTFGSGSTTPWRQNGPDDKTAVQYAALKGVATNSQNIFGTGGTFSAAHDTRLVLTGDWGADSAVSIGGPLFSSPSAVGSPKLSFSSLTNVDTFDVYVVETSSSGSMTIDVNGGAVQATTTTVGSFALTKYTVTASLGLNTVNCTHTAGSVVYLCGIVAYNSAVKSVNMLGMGWGGSRSVEWNQGGAAYLPLDSLKTVAPHLTIINLGINDWNNATVINTFKTNIQAVIDAAKVSGDVMLVGPVPSDTNGFASAATQQTYITALSDLATANDIPMLSIFGRWQSYSVSNALGRYADSLHPNDTGYSDIASFFAQALVRVS